MDSTNSKITEKFDILKKNREAALISYVMMGFPSMKGSISAVKGLVDGGADIIELGFPFSDPLADGPVIQEAATVSLNKGINIDKFFQMVRLIKKETSTKNIPLVLMTYTNILYAKGYEQFIEKAVRVGIDGLILPDMSIDESVAGYLKAARNHNMDTIFLASPNTSDERMRRIVDTTTGFLYMVAIYGTTGSQQVNNKSKEIAKYTLQAIKTAKKQTRNTNLPVGVGFGVSSKDQVTKYVRAGADAVIVGSAYTRLIKEVAPIKIRQEVAELTRKLKSGTVNKPS